MSSGVAETLFWTGVAVVIYTYIGYGILLYLLVRIKEMFFPPSLPPEIPEAELPEVTLFIAAYNEEDIVEEKMANCRALDYPSEKLHILWVTDGSQDHTPEKLRAYPGVEVQHRPERRGKTAAINRGMPFVHTPYTVFTDANTMLDRQALKEIIRPFTNPRTGCVSGEKRIAVRDKDTASSGGEGFYWKYESKLKAWDARLYSAIGAAGELFAIRTSLFAPLPEDTLLDDFMISMHIARKGYRIAYCAQAYALEEASADMKNEEKRKVRIAAGGLQSIGRLATLLIPDPFHLGIFRFQYISHRVLRWSVTPVFLFLLFPLNAVLAFWPVYSPFYMGILLLQCLFYTFAYLGYLMQQKQLKIKVLFIPYYFLFMNLNVIRAFTYLKKHRGSGAWEKARRKNS